MNTKISTLVFPIIAFSALLYISCNKVTFEESPSGAFTSHKKSILATKATRDSTDIVFHYLTDPYRLDIMQHAFDSIATLHHKAKVRLRPTHRYTRFLPADSTQYYALVNLGLELYNVPLDCEIEGDYEDYHDPTVSPDTLTWQYTAVPANIIIPSTIRQELIHNCFIPDEEEFLSRNQDSTSRFDYDSEFIYEAETLAYLIANPELVYKIEQTRGDGMPLRSPHPNGYVRVEKDNSTYTPVKGIKVRTHSFVKIDNAYTDEYGFYSMSKSFFLDPTYSLHFENSIGFELMGTILSFAPTWNSFGEQPNTGYNFYVNKSHDAWYGCAVNNGVYDYFQTCNNTGRIAPPDDLRIILMDNSGNLSGSGAPMLRHLGYQNLNSYSQDNILQGLLHINIAVVAMVFTAIIRYGLPDIVFVNNTSYNYLVSTVHHELSHASHFMQSGTSLWLQDIQHIIENGGGYGDGLSWTSTEKICELIEAWGNASEKYFDDSIGIGDQTDSSEWFRPSVMALYNLMNESILSDIEILSCLTPTVCSIDDLYDRLCLSYPGKLKYITDCFVREAALHKQSIWKLINHRVSDLNISCSPFSFSLDYGGSCRIVSIPNTVTSYTNLHVDYPSYYPVQMIFSHNANAFYMESAPNNIYMSTPLFSRSGWVEQKDTVLVGNKIVHNYTFTITSSF